MIREMELLFQASRSDRLTEIEERARRKQQNCDDVLGDGYVTVASFKLRDVLALVEVAKAARRVNAAFAADPHDVNELWNASGQLRAALSALDGEAT